LICISNSRILFSIRWYEEEKTIHSFLNPVGSSANSIQAKNLVETPDVERQVMGMMAGWCGRRVWMGKRRGDSARGGWANQWPFELEKMPPSPSAQRRPDHWWAVTREGSD